MHRDGPRHRREVGGRERRQGPHRGPGQRGFLEDDEPGFPGTGLDPVGRRSARTAGRGHLFRFFEIPPQEPNLTAEEAERTAEAAFAAAGASRCRVDTRRHPMMHTTSTIDYVVVLRGRVTLLLDQAEVRLSPFDVVVQRGTNHYWLNPGPDPALLMGVLLDAR